jgi:hypothetical protein
MRHQKAANYEKHINPKKAVLETGDSEVITQNDQHGNASQRLY